MQKKLTITIDEKVYESLYRVIGAGKISQFIERIIRPHIMEEELDAAYKSMATEEDREREALTWAESTHTDTGDEKG